MTPPPKHDGTDSAVDPIRAYEPRVFGLPPGQWSGLLAPAIVAAIVIGLWEALVTVKGVPSYVLPPPSLIIRTLVQEWSPLSASLLVTLRITALALLAAIALGIGLAVLFNQSQWLEKALLPYAIVLQVTPIVAIAPLIIIWVDDVGTSLLICAWLVAFFPILSNTIVGLNSADHNLISLFKLYRATRLQTLRYLRLPTALPYFLAGLKVSGGLALIGAVVAEFVAGTGGSASGLAYRILESGYQLQIPRMFAALLLVSLTGIVIFIGASVASHFLLRNWHESAVKKDP